jgi:hypothetical protein
MTEKTTTDSGLAVLDELVGLDWFSRTGTFAGTADAKPVKTWKKAVASSQCVDWKNIKLETANELRAKIQAVSIELYQTWNAAVIPLRDRVKEVVGAPVAAYLAKHDLSPKVLNSVQWDVLHAAMEAHYSHVASPGAYTKMLALYRQGHFPCGWVGEWPEGVMLVL